jgi:hypothetical protein
MRDVIKKFSAFFIAALILLGVLFLPDANLQTVSNQLKYIAKSEKIAMSLGQFLLRGTIKGLIILILTGVFSYMFHLMYKKRLK